MVGVNILYFFSKSETNEHIYWFMMKVSMAGGLFITCMVNLWLVKKGTIMNVSDISVFIFKYLF
jgi:hypothetical protein